MFTALLLVLLAAAPAAPVKPAQFQRALKAQQRSHAKQRALPWTSSALKRLLPSRCAGQSRDDARILPLEPHEHGGVRLAYGRGPERVELFLVDLAGHPAAEAGVHFEEMQSTVAALTGGLEGTAAGLHDRPAVFKPAGKGLGFWFPAEHGGVAQGQALVGGRFLVRLMQPERADAAAREAAYECLKSVNYRAMLAETRGRKRR